MTTTDKTITYGPALQKLLNAFPDAYEKSNGWWAHDDNPRFDFRERENGSIAIHSWTGRSPEDILALKNLTPNDITPRGYFKTKIWASLDVLELAYTKKIDWRFLLSPDIALEDGYRYKGYSCVKIPYYLPDGTQHTKIKVRKAISGEHKHCWNEDTPGNILPYGLHKLDMARKAGYLLIGEGETDAWACWYHNEPYLGIPGVDHHNALTGINLNDIPAIYIIVEPDQFKRMINGQGFYRNIHSTLRSQGYKGSIFCIDFMQATQQKDPSDLHIAYWNMPDQFTAIMTRAREHAIPANGTINKVELEPKVSLCIFDADDSGNGDAMKYLYGKRFLWCASRGWFIYTGTHWKLDSDGAEVKQKAVETLRKRRHAAVDEDKDAIIKCTKADDKRVNGCINRFKTLVNVDMEDFDSSPDMLNCKNGVVDLRSGEIEPHTYTQRFTYCLPVEYGEAECPEWLDYLQGVIGGGQEVIDYLQKALGYSLTGHTREEILFYLYGPTRSGKGTFAETVMALLPTPLSTMVDFNSFTAKREGDVSNFDLAPLKPSRMIFASESQKNQSLNPAKIKQLTGGDLVRACYKHRDFFDYRPQFKVWMLSNWPVNGDPEDNALWGRVRVIEFPHSFLGKEDKTKKAHLKDPEVLKGILYWAVQGAIAWYRLGAAGLTTPKTITDKTNEQRAELDFVQQWLDECTTKDAAGWASNEVVTSSYTEWCKSNTVQYPKGAKALTQSLKTKGYTTGVQKWSEGKNKKGISGLVIVPNTGQLFLLSNEILTPNDPNVSFRLSPFKEKESEKGVNQTLEPLESMYSNSQTPVNQPVEPVPTSNDMKKRIVRPSISRDNRGLETLCTHCHNSATRYGAGATPYCETCWMSRE